MTAPSTSTLGILGARRPFELERFEPCPELSFFVERHWIVRWDLETPHRQETLPHPCVNLVFERGKTAFHGIGTRRFEVLLEGRGMVVGTKFRPGAFQPFHRGVVAETNDRAVGLREIFGEVDVDALEHAVLAGGPPVVESFLRERLPAHDPNVAAVIEIVRVALADRSIVKVEELVARSGVSARTMQRLFRRYVGVSPKWVIRRFRIQEAAERALHDALDWATLAADLGYCDQAHFSRDFRAQVGASPRAYVAQHGR